MKLIKNQEMIDRDLQHKSVAKLYVIDFDGLRAEYNQLHERCDYIWNRLVRELTINQFKRLNNGYGIRAITHKQRLIELHDERELLLARKTQISKELDILMQNAG